MAVALPACRGMAFESLRANAIIMKIFSTFFAIGSLVLLGAGCGSGSDSADAAKDSNAVKMDSPKGDSTARTIPATVSKADQDFAVNTAIAGMTEIQAGQMAQQKGMSKDVKDYGDMMVKDHTAAADKLKAIATQKNITLPATLTPDAQKNLDDLQKEDGKKFDKDYLAMMVSDHKKVISAFENESKNGSDADIRAFADSTLHTLRIHLDKAEKCEKMEKKM
jgi:putative membrane protein